MKKLLIVGGTGMVGKDISNFLKDKYNIFIGTIEKNVEIECCEIVHMDITDREDTIRKIFDINPEFIIHLAALTDVNLCEENKEVAIRVNIEGTKNIVLASEKINARLIYASTNYVFNGEKGMKKIRYGFL